MAFESCLVRSEGDIDALKMSEARLRAPMLGMVARELSKDEETIETLKKIHEELELDLEVSKIIKNISLKSFVIHILIGNSKLPSL